MLGVAFGTRPSPVHAAPAAVGSIVTPFESRRTPAPTGLSFANAFADAPQDPRKDPRKGPREAALRRVHLGDLEAPNARPPRPTANRAWVETSFYRRSLVETTTWHAVAVAQANLTLTPGLALGVALPMASRLDTPTRGTRDTSFLAGNPAASLTLARPLSPTTAWEIGLGLTLPVADIGTGLDSAPKRAALGGAMGITGGMAPWLWAPGSAAVFAPTRLRHTLSALLSLDVWAAPTLTVALGDGPARDVDAFVPMRVGITSVSFPMAANVPKPISGREPMSEPPPPQNGTNSPAANTSASQPSGPNTREKQSQRGLAFNAGCWLQALWMPTTPEELVQLSINPSVGMVINPTGFRQTEFRLGGVWNLWGPYGLQGDGLDMWGIQLTGGAQF